MSQREIRMYRFYFSDVSRTQVENYVEIEAENRIQAKAMLNKIVHSQKRLYEGRQLWGEKVIRPLYGVTKKFVNGVEWTWVGFEISPVDGWMETFLYQMRLKESKQNSKIIHLKTKR